MLCYESLLFLLFAVQLSCVKSRGEGKQFKWVWKRRNLWLCLPKLELESSQIGLFIWYLIHIKGSKMGVRLRFGNMGVKIDYLSRSLGVDRLKISANVAKWNDISQIKSYCNFTTIELWFVVMGGALHYGMEKMGTICVHAVVPRKNLICLKIFWTQ